MAMFAVSVLEVVGAEWVIPLRRERIMEVIEMMGFILRVLIEDLVLLLDVFDG